MGRCDTCKHWFSDNSDWEFQHLGVGDCKGIDMREDISRAAHQGFDDEWTDAGREREGAAIRAARAFVVDASGYYAALRTRPDFGCVLHEPAPDTMEADNG